jgi:hypothetical protein
MYFQLWILPIMLATAVAFPVPKDDLVNIRQVSPVLDEIKALLGSKLAEIQKSVAAIAVSFTVIMLAPTNMVHETNTTFSTFEYRIYWHIRPPQAERRCKICMAHRPSTIVNPFAIRPPLREGICLARAT